MPTFGTTEVLLVKVWSTEDVWEFPIPDVELNMVGAWLVSTGAGVLTGCITGRAIYEGKLDFAAAARLAAGES